MSGASDPDVSLPLSNNNIQESTSETLPDKWQIGVPSKDFNIHQAVLYTHGYFQKVQLRDGVRAKCMVCWVENKKKALFKVTDNSTKGS